MSGGQTIFRGDPGPENPYCMVLNAPLNDERLSWAARGMLVHLLSKPLDWRISMENLINSSPVGRDGVRTILRELESYGYLTRKQRVNEAGQFDGLDVTLHAVPVAPQTAFPSPAGPLPANPPLQKTETTQKKETTPPATAAPRRERTRDPLFDAFVEEWGFDPMKPANKIKGLAGDFSARVKRTNKGIDVPTLLVAWREFAAYSRKERHGGQAKWGSVVQQHNATDQFLSWLTVNGPNAGRVWGEGAIRDERWYFVDPSGRMALKAPRIAIAELGLSCDPHRPQTWPQDMYEVYRSRLVTIDGQEVFA